MLEIVRERPREPGHFEPHHEGVFLGFLEHGRRIEILARVILREDERRTAFARKQVGHNQCAGPVVALDEQLWFAEDTDIDTSRAAPNALIFFKSTPIHDFTDAAVRLLVEAGLGRFNEPMMACPHGGFSPQSTAAFNSSQ